MKKVLLLQDTINEYRVTVFNQLAKKYDLTVTYSRSDNSPKETLYKRVKISEWKLGPFYFHGMLSLCHKYDVVIYLPSPNRPCFCLVPFMPHRYKTISLSIGMRASYTRHLDIHRPSKFLDRLFGLIQFKADAVLVYFKETLAFWDLNKDDLKKCFQTRNTTDVIECNIEESKKNSILFVGTLYKEKKVDVLIKAYKKVFEKYKTPNFPNLEIIGKGDQYETLKNLIIQLKLEDKVALRGPVYDENILMGYHQRALVSISPNQAGLSVPKSLGYGVPFVTIRDAITGGEILHIKNGFNGILMESLDDLPSLIEDVVTQPSKYIEMGKNAKDYYEKEASIEIMVKGFSDAIEYALNN